MPTRKPARPTNPAPRGRWDGVIRPYEPSDVARLRGTLSVRHTFAERGATRLWELLTGDGHVPALGAATGMQAVQMVRAGLPAIYVSGWQVAADANLAGHTYPDQSLYPSNSVPALVRRIQAALQRADQIDHAAGRSDVRWFAPVVADAEAGFGGPLNAYETARALIEAGADVLWWETSTPDLVAARRFAEAVHAAFPGKLLAYNCSPSFNWKLHLDAAALRRFQTELAAMGYRFQFVTLAGFHSVTHGMYTLARDYAERGMAAYADLQAREIAAEADGYTAARHQAEVGTGYFDEVARIVGGGESSTAALAGSTEAAQFTRSTG